MLIKQRMILCLTALLALAPAGSVAAEIIHLHGERVYGDEVLVRLKEPNGGGLRAAGIAAESVEAVAPELVPGLLLLKKPADLQAQGAAEEDKAKSLEAWIAKLKNSGQFEYVEPNYIRSYSATPADARFTDGTLWALNNYGQNGGATGADISATNAWDLTTGSTNVIVAVIDSGVRYTHQDLAAQMWVNPTETPGNGIDDDNDGYVDNIYGVDTFNNDGDPNDDVGHGTHVAGTIGAAANDGNPHVGVIWQVRMIACKVGGPAGLPSAAVVRGIDFATQRGARVMNASYGGYSFSQAEFDAILAARDAGVLFVAAAGNESNDNDRFQPYPASYKIDNIISVAALDRADRLADFSNFGSTTVHIGAPGVEIFSTYNGSDNSYDVLQGTSMAAPHVAGVAALVAAYASNASYSEIRARILDGAVPIPSLEGRTITGGRLNAHRALTRGVDGILEVSVVPPSGAQLTIGTNTIISVSVSDGLPVTNATVTATVSGATISFANDGVAPDLVAEDNVYTASYFIPNTPGILNLSLAVSAPGKTNFSEAVTYEAVLRPDNDNFATPLKVPAVGGTFEQNTRFATLEANEPKHADVVSSANSVWYAWSLPKAANVIVDSAGSTYDTVIGVYTGSTLSSLVEVASTNDVGSKAQGWLKFAAQAGVTYKIALAGANTNDAGQLRVRFEVNGEPDVTAPVVQITSPVSGLTVTSDRVGLSGTAHDPLPNASGVSDVFVRVNEGEPIRAAGTTNWASTNLLNLGLNVIRVVAFDFAQNASIEQRVTVNYRPEQLPNDLFARAGVLTGTSGSVTSTNVDAGKEFLEPNHAGNAGGKSVWYTFTAVSDGVLLLNTSGSTFDTLLAVYRGDRVSNLVELASNDDVPGGSEYSEVTFGVHAGEIYHIAVDGFDASSGTVRVNYNFSSAQTFAVTATVRGEGTVLPANGLFPLNSTVTVLATPDAYFQFDRFETPDGTLVSTENPYNLRVTGATSLVAVFSPQQFTDDFETGSLAKLPYVVSGWAVTSESLPASGGSFAARSTAAADQNRITNSLVLVTRTGAGIGSFDFRVSSEPNYDRLDFYVDNALRASWSGEVSWATYQFEVAAGSSRLEWRYVKDSALRQGLDAAFIDNLDLPDAPAQGDVPSMQLRVNGASREITVTGTAGASYVLEASSDLRTWSTLTTVEIGQDGAGAFVDSASVTRRFYRARSL